MTIGRRVKRGRGGELQLRLPTEERELLRGLPAQLRTLLDQEPDDPALQRLFPPAYVENPEHESEFRRLMGEDLRAKHLSALAVLEETVDADHLSPEQAHGWLAALNDLRLVLGTRLDVSEEMLGEDIDPDDPQAPALALYGYLSWLQEQLVEALTAS
ncbi:MAG: DUF2017 domain-containing protein [Actinomycetota bacterium]|nr:DUF2017 domain-containing protein [Actinomycetota bacterium]MDQ3575024.1 DUF2017 domain-containing protein [Actinomycetota bacterium]